MLLIVTVVQISFSQTLKIGGKQISFGMSEKDLIGTFWKEGVQIKSDHPYINLYEGTNSDYFINGSFYDGKLISIWMGGELNLPIPEIESIVSGVSPYKSDSEQIDNLSKAFADCFKTPEYYICIVSFRLVPEYTIIPITMLENIQKTHPEYLTYFNK